MLAGWAAFSDACAQSLDAASHAALDTSFGLRADRERQEGAEARLRGSIDNFMPSLSIVLDRPLTSSITYDPQQLPTTVGLDAIPREAPRQNGFVANLPLFDGFKRWNNYQSARSLVEAGEHTTISQRQQVLLDTSAAYLAVLRDTRIVGFRTDQIAAANRLEAATAKQFTVNDATRTDVALAKSRVQAADAALERAKADLEASRIEFRRLTKLEPEQLAPPRVPRLLPGSADAYADLVRGSNPRLRAARLDVQSSEYLADAASAELFPTLNLQASENDQYGYAPGLNRISDQTVRLIATLPIYEPGAFPRISEAKAAARQRGYEVQDSELATVTSARASYARRLAVGKEMKQLKTRVGDLQATLQGFEIERGAGFRTVIDELNVQAELADAKVAVAIVAAQYDGLTFTLAAAAGLLTADATAANSEPAALATLKEFGRTVPNTPARTAAAFQPSWHLKAAIAATATLYKADATASTARPTAPATLKKAGRGTPQTATPTAAFNPSWHLKTAVAPFDDPAPALRGTEAAVAAR